MSPALLDLYKRNEIGFEDVFELYAQMCIDHTREMTQDNIDDEGLEDYIKQVGAPTVSRLTAEAVDWADEGATSMLGDILQTAECKKKEDESWLQFCIRASIEKRVQATDAFKLKLS